jgi:hypothetical protein
MIARGIEYLQCPHDLPFAWKFTSQHSSQVLSFVPNWTVELRMYAV